jgi:ADP-L-glycero-D-manno-heptose 6-epimerase
MIVVTGGVGFIGSAVIWALNRQGRKDILVVDTLGTDERWKNLVNLRFTDFIEKQDFLDQLQKGALNPAISGILHLGACSSTTERDAGFLMRNNHQYTQHLAQWCLEHKKRFVYASSAATYGDGQQGFSDDHAKLETLKPLNMYGYSKHLSDMWALQNGLLDKIAGLKYFNVFGPNEYHKDDMRSVVHKAYCQIHENSQVRLFKSHREGFKDGWQLRDFIYVKDAVAATLGIYENPKANGIFNIGTGQARSFYDLVVATFHAMDLEPYIEYIDMPETIRDKYQYFTQAQTGRLKNLGLDTMHSLEDAITDYVRNYILKDDPYLKLEDEPCAS